MAMFPLLAGRSYVVAMDVPSSLEPFASASLIQERAKEMVGDVESIAVWSGKDFPRSEIAAFESNPKRVTKFEGAETDYVAKFKKPSGGPAHAASFDPKHVAWIIDVTPGEAPANPWEDKNPPPGPLPKPNVEGAEVEAIRFRAEQAYAARSCEGLLACLEYTEGRTRIQWVELRAGIQRLVDEVCTGQPPAPEPAGGTGGEGVVVTPKTEPSKAPLYVLGGLGLMVLVLLARKRRGRS